MTIRSRATPQLSVIRLLQRFTISVTLVFFLACPLLLGAASSSLPVAHAKANEQVPAITFVGSLNLLGILDAVNVSPPTLEISAGTNVRIRNESGVSLVVNVNGQEAQVADSHELLVHFPGASETQNLPIHATSVNIPLVGKLTSTSAMVVVAPRAAEQSSAPPEPSPSMPKVSSSPVEEEANKPSQNSTEGEQPYFLAGEVDTSNSDADLATGGERWERPQRGDVQSVSERSPLTPLGLGGETLSQEVGLALVVAMVLIVGIGIASARYFAAYISLRRLQ